jgi:hypothetical protein
MGRLPLAVHFFGVGNGLFCHIHTAQHAGNLADPALIVQGFDFREGRFLFCELANEQVLMALGCHLWQVGNTQHLTVFAECPQ